MQSFQEYVKESVKDVLEDFEEFVGKPIKLDNKNRIKGETFYVSLKFPDSPYREKEVSVQGDEKAISDLEMLIRADHKDFRITKVSDTELMIGELG